MNIYRLDRRTRGTHIASKWWPVSLDLHERYNDVIQPEAFYMDQGEAEDARDALNRQYADINEYRVVECLIVPGKVLE